MGEIAKFLVVGALLLATAVPLGCGSSGPMNAGDTLAKASRPYPWLKGPSREFLVPGGDNAVQTFGEEATPKERAEATVVISAWLRARAAKDWSKDCSYLSRAYAKAIAADAHGVTDGKVKETCPAALAYFKGNASGNFVNTLSGSIDSLRVGEGQGVEGDFTNFAYAQYHGNDGKDWIVPLEREAGEWKVSKAAPLNRLR